MSPAEIAELADFIAQHEQLGPSALAALIAEKYVAFLRVEPRHVSYCDECGFSGGTAGHHPKCTKYDRYSRIPEGRNAL